MIIRYQIDKSGIHSQEIRNWRIIQLQKYHQSQIPIIIFCVCPQNQNGSLFSHFSLIEWHISELRQNNDIQWLLWSNQSNKTFEILYWYCSHFPCIYKTNVWAGATYGHICVTEWSLMKSWMKITNRWYATTDCISCKET